ncbi:hypothetical protein BR93DRAFT_966507 [Coniochaeta sp. PMI_546]|nr:hypothetical protein BR93DRAFT_966507 [Coniochaeta sp. PMI_546]
MTTKAEETNKTDQTTMPGIKIRPLPQRKPVFPSSNDSDTDEVLSESCDDLSVDLDDEKGKAALRHTRDERADAVVKSTAAKFVEYKGPLIAYKINSALNSMTASDDATLRDDERALLLSLGDLACRALAIPDSLTTKEMYNLISWPAPDTLRAPYHNLKLTDGAPSKSSELNAEATGGINTGLALGGSESRRDLSDHPAFRDKEGQSV